LNVLVIDIGGAHVNFRSTQHIEKQEIPSGPKLTPGDRVRRVQAIAAHWHYDRVSIGYPGPVLSQRIVSEPHTLGRGWVGFNFQAAFDCPVRIINDAAMQALGGYRGDNSDAFEGGFRLWRENTNNKETRLCNSE